LVNKLYALYNKFYPEKYKSFEDVLEKDVYELICYRLKLEDNTEIVRTELGIEDIEEIEENNKIRFIIIEYMFNSQFMKYITYKQDIRFPIYPFRVEPTKYLYYPESIFINEIDITSYISPYLGPLCNFYLDREEPVKLKDAIINHPDFDKINFDDGLLIMISNETPLNGKKCIIKKLPCNLIWKRHAAVDPKDEYKLN
jgi:hypothetical protein